MSELNEFEAWLRTVCFQKPTPGAYDLAKCAWIESRKQAESANSALLDEAKRHSELMKGKVVLPVKPLMTNEMKAEHIGEYSVQFPVGCHECEENPEEICGACNGEGQYMQEINIPWDTCKRIYKAMYTTAVLQALQQSTPTPLEQKKADPVYDKLSGFYVDTPLEQSGGKV